jgi:hypothetical protein
MATSPSGTTDGVTSNVASSATAVTVFPANARSMKRVIYNDSTAVLRLKFGAGASATSFTMAIPANALYEFPTPLYRGVVTGIWESANGSARTTEY